MFPSQRSSAIWLVVTAFIRSFRRPDEPGHYKRYQERPWLWLMPLVLAILHVQSAYADLHFPQVTADLGQVRGATMLAHRFTFTNSGPDAVEIIETRPTCGCSTSSLEKRSYQPGESGTLVLEINTLSQPAGNNTWGVHVHYRVGEQMRETLLCVTGHVIKDVTVQPAAMTVQTDAALAHEIVITDIRPRPLSITAVDTTCSWLKAQPLAVGHDASGHWLGKVRVAIAADCPEGRHNERVDIFTDDPDYRDLRIPVTIVKRAGTAHHGHAKRSNSDRPARPADLFPNCPDPRQGRRGRRHRPCCCR